jgi:DNA polymerase I-like protein with 3'-5' exonuclease and polymerase domains
VLQELAADFPIAARLLEPQLEAEGHLHRLPLMVNPATGRVQPTYAQAVAVTGRL